MYLGKLCSKGRYTEFENRVTIQIPQTIKHLALSVRINIQEN